MPRKITPKARKTQTKRLQFKYCECGCHGHESTPVAGLHFWIFNDLKGSFFLHRGHNLGALIGTYKSHDEAVSVATDLAKREVKKLQAAFV